MSLASEQCRLAFELYERRVLNKQQLIDVLEKVINSVAQENGYADRYGLPFPTERR